MSTHTFVGFGFGPIQSGLFLFEAFRSGNFRRLVVAEVVPEVVAALRAAGGRYHLNIAAPGGVERHTVTGIEVYNPRVAADRAALVDALAEAQEIGTALPSVNVYDSPDPAGVANVLADGARRKLARGGPCAVIYTAENHNHAAERLSQALQMRGVGGESLSCLNTVIGKMSGTVTEAAEMAAQGLAPITAGASRAFLVEAFNRILISRVPWPDFVRGIGVFEEKDDLLPFEEAKLYGHNAIHALLGYRLWQRGARFISDAAADPALMAVAREAFLQESGRALCRKYAGLDPLFTPAGYRAYADDLLARMVNPFLRDAVERVTRDPRRKLGWNDRLVGTMRLVRTQGFVPRHFARAARTAVQMLAAIDPQPADTLLRTLWAGEADNDQEQDAIISLIKEEHDED
ncbi:MAG: hypothetical protein K8T26_14440 [Lentisphaerae bacterium]|nr:hypothetical protein [Lentisphaerota bacterium]